MSFFEELANCIKCGCLEQIAFAAEELSQAAYNLEGAPEDVQLKEHFDEAIKDVCECMRVYAALTAEEAKWKSKTRLAMMRS